MKSTISNTGFTCILSLLLILFSAIVSAEIVESIEYKYYEISPRSVYEIKSELMRRSPIHDHGGSFNGHTDWFINWRFQSMQTPYGCQLKNIRTKVHVIHTLPALSSYVSDQKTIDVFNKFNDALTKHELNHGKNGLSAAREMDKAFKEIPVQRNCRELSRIIDYIGNSSVQKHIRADNDYDRSTQNGKTEGAVIY